MKGEQVQVLLCEDSTPFSDAVHNHHAKNLEKHNFAMQDVLLSDLSNIAALDRQQSALDQEDSLPSVESSPPKMTFSSSPVAYPPSSSPVLVKKKRKLFQTLDLDPAKKQRLLGADVRGDNAHRKEEHAGALIETPGLATTERHTNMAEQIYSIDDIVADISETNARPQSPNLPPLLEFHAYHQPNTRLDLCTSSGRNIKIATRKRSEFVSFERTVAKRSVTGEGRAKKAYYGVDIHDLIRQADTERDLRRFQEEAEAEKVKNLPEERPISRDSNTGRRNRPQQLWTEKYRPRKFTELIGDERTHRAVLKWLKGWDSIVFPGSVKPKPKKIFEDQDASIDIQHRKILLLTGPPGLGKTTLAHVCAKHAGYEVLEINASDDRSRDVVKGKIKDALGTENVRGIKEHGKTRKAGRPICVIVDEVDGVVSGSGGGGGEGGFMKALIDLVQLDQKTASRTRTQSTNGRKGVNFRQLRPLILICNDVYAPSLRPLRGSTIAEIVHVRKPAIAKVIARLRTVLEQEQIPCDNDAVRRLCENSWGLGTRKQNSLGGRGSGEGDIRGVLVQGEWIARKLRTSYDGNDARLTRKWVEEHLGQAKASSGQKGLGRGGLREVVDRIFVEGAGLPNLPTTLSAEDKRLVAESKDNPVGVANLRKRAAIDALREMVDTCGEHDRLMTDCFASYPNQVYQDDANLSKPNAGYEWLHFHDRLSTRIFSGQEWELNPYLSTSACGFHHLFASVDKGDKSWNDDKPKDTDENTDTHPFSGLKADFAAYEAGKQNQTLLTEFQSAFPGPLLRLFRSTDVIATELLPDLGRMVAPDVKPVIIGGRAGAASIASVRKDTEKRCISSAVRVMRNLNVSLEKIKVEIEGGGAHSNAAFVYRMEP